MKSLKSLLESRGQLITELEALESRIESADNPLTAEEVTRVNAIADELTTVNSEIEAAQKRENVKRTINIQTNSTKDTVEGVTERFSFVRAVEALSNHRQLDGVEAEMHQEGAKEFRGIGASGNLYIPTMLSGKFGKRANINENSTAGVDVLGFAEGLQARSIASQLGVQFVNLVADGKFVIQTGTTVTWEGEVDSNADGGTALSTASITPKRLATKVLLSKQLINQHSFSVEQAFINDIVRAVSAKLDYSLFNDDGFTEHAGNGVTPIAEATVGGLMGALVEKLMMSNADMGSLAFAASAGLYAEIATSTQVSAVSPLLVNGNAFGHPVLFSSQISDNGSAQEQIYFANWSDFVIGQWGGLDILVDPYTAADTGQVKLVLNSFWDGNQKRTASFALGAYTGTDIS